MKRSLFTNIKRAALAIPAAALMLGAAQAGTTVGLNFQTWYYDSGVTPQTIGFMGTGYSAYGATGFPVTAKAFGVSPANWFNTDPMDGHVGNPINAAPTFGGVSTFAGGLSCNVNSPKGGFQSGSGCKFASGLAPYPAYAPGVFCPQGEDELLWGIIVGDDANPFSVSVSGLAAKFPGGYVIQALSAHGGYSTVNSLPKVDFTDGTTTTTAAYHTWVINNDPAAQWPTATAGISDPSGVFTADTIYFNSGSDATNILASLAGVIITDQPVVTQSAPATTVTTPGSTFVLTSTAIGIGTLSYQWQHAGTNLLGANAAVANYTNSSAATTDSGSYEVLVTSSSFPSFTATGAVLTVAVHAAVTDTWDANTGTSGALDGSGTWSLAGNNWWTGSANDVFYTNDSAIFGAGGAGSYTVTLADSITANSITFSSGTYTIANASSQTLSLSGSPALAGNANGIITVPISVANVFVKAGTGSVTLAGALTSTNIFVSAGTLEVQAKAGDAPYIVTNGATLKIGYSTGGGYANTGMQLYGDGTSATTGWYLKGGTTYSVNGQPTLLGAPTTIRQYGSGLAALAIYDINGNGLNCTAAASGSIIDSNIQLVNGGYGMALAVEAGANNATGDLIINGPLSIDAHNGVYGLVKRGNGSIRLNAAATATNSALDIRAGSAVCGIDNCIGANAVLKVPTNSTADLKLTSQTVTNATLAGALKISINKGGSPSSGKLLALDPATALTYGGTLVVTNVGGALVLNDTFTLFSAAVGYSGAFSSITLPPVPNGLAWQDNTAVDGTIKVVVGSTAPFIVTDLSGGTNYAYVGGSSTFNITGGGDPILHYQWKKNGTTVVGTDSPTLTLTGLTLGSAGKYSCTVTNNFGTAQSMTNYLLVATPSLAAATAVQDGALVIWPLVETAPSTAYEYMAAKNGTQNGTLTLGAVGPVPPAYAGFNPGTTAYQFDGASSYIDCGTAPALSGTTDFTLEAWIKTTNTLGSTIIQQRTTGGSGYIGQYRLTLNGNGTAGFMVYNTGYQFNINTAAAGRRVNDGKWHHIAAVRSGVNGYVYIDGSLAGSGSGAIQSLVSTLPVSIGADTRDNNSYFNGSMCDVAIYNTALSVARVGVHASTGVLATAPLTLSIVPGGWTEDSKPVGALLNGLNLGASWLASSTDANTVTRTGVAKFSSGAQIAIPADTNINSTTGTICFWMQTAVPSAGTGQMLVDRRTGNGMVIALNGTPDGGFNIQYTGTPGYSSGGYVIDDLWHQISITYDQSVSGSVSTFIDGVLVNTQPNAAAWSWPAGQPMELGRSHDTYWQEYNGLMDDFRVYNRILTGSEITTIATPASSADLVDTAALMVRYNFGTAVGVGKALSWPQIGVLQSTPALAAPAVWTPTNTTTAGYPFLPPSGVTNAALFYQLKQ